MKTGYRFYTARSRVAITNKPATLTLSAEPRRKLFLEGPLKGFPLFSRLGASEKEVHYMLDEHPALILELKKLGPDLDREPSFASFRKSFLDLATRSKDQQTNVYAVPFDDEG